MKKFFIFDAILLRFSFSECVHVCCVCLQSVYYLLQFFALFVMVVMVFQGLWSSVFGNIFCCKLEINDLKQFLLSKKKPQNSSIRKQQNHFPFGCSTVKLNFIYIIRVHNRRAQFSIRLLFSSFCFTMKKNFYDIATK